LKTEKSCTTLFTLSPKQKVGPRCVSNTLWADAEGTTYLGLTFDKWLTWKAHKEQAKSKTKRSFSPSENLQAPHMEPVRTY
jgi:hypothetical protein